MFPSSSRAIRPTTKNTTPCHKLNVIPALQEKTNRNRLIFGISRKNLQRKLVSSHKVLPISSGFDALFDRRVSRNKGIKFPLVFLFLSICCIEWIQCANQVSPSTVTGLGKPISSSSSSSSRTEGKDGRGNTDDSESTSNHHHHHNYQHRHHHRHGSSTSSGKTSPFSSSSSSIYPPTSAYGYSDYYNSDPFYEPRYYERPSREFSARSTSYPAIAASASSQVGFPDTEYGGLAMATGHGGGSHHGSHGHHGHDAGGYGHHTTYYKTVNKLDQSSLGLLGLLGLLSLLSNVLMLLTTTARASSMMPADGGGGMVNLRIKRDAVMLVKLKDREESTRKKRSVVEQLSRLILPSLNIVGHAKDGRIPVNCTYQEVCKTNRILIQVFGADNGRPVGSVMSTAIAKLLSDNDSKREHSHHRPVSAKVRNEHQSIPVTAEGPFVLVEKHLTQAGLAGRNGEDCEIAYPTCEALSYSSDKDYDTVNEINKKNGGRVQLPLLISPERALAIILGQSLG